MTGVHRSLTETHSNSIAEVASVESCYPVLHIPPPDYVEKTTWYLQSSVGLDKVSQEPAGAESDSGDSLFITQKPVPEAVRSGRRHRSDLRLDLTSSTDLDESESDTSSESRTDKERRRKRCTLPKYSFPFLSEGNRSPKSTLNITLHNFAMGGFFKSVRQLWQSDQRGDNPESALPTVDTEGEDISPLSEGEEEEERSEDEDIKVVERKRFVAPSKGKRQQTWCDQSKQRRRKADNAKRETSQGRRCKPLHKAPAKASVSRVSSLCLDTESTDDEESSCRVRVEKERNDEHQTSDGNFLTQKETPNTKRQLTQGSKNIFQQKAMEEELSTDSDATVCEPNELQRSSKQYTQKNREASTSATEPQMDVFHTDHLPQTGQTEDEPESQTFLHSLLDPISDINNDKACNETSIKEGEKKKNDKGDHESAEDEKGQSQEEPEPEEHAATSVNVEVEETPSLSQDNRTEPLASHTSDVLEFNERNCVENSSHDDTVLGQEESDIPDSKQKKKKRKKNKSAAEDVRQEVDGNLESDVRMEDSVFSVSCNMENGGEEKKKKKKRNRSSEDDEDMGQLQSSVVAKPLNNDAGIWKKKEKQKKEERVVITEDCEEEGPSNRTLDLPPMSTGQLEESGKCPENTATSQETSESTYVKRKKHKKKRSSFNGAPHDGQEGAGVSFSNDTVILEESTDISLKKKKKKKKKKTISGGAEFSDTPEENEKAEIVDMTQKTKEGFEDQHAEMVTKKKKKGDRSSRNISEDIAAQSDDLVSVRKKEKKRTSSFLVADAEEHNAQTHAEAQNSPSQTESAKIAENLEVSNDGVRKKKRKRKMSVEQDVVKKDHEQHFEEPNKTCQSALTETTDMGVKRKKKHTGNESELVSLMERLESAADAEYCATDEAVVLMKKKKKKKKKCKDEPCHVIQESPPSATESEKSSLNTCKHLTSPLVAKDKHGRSAEISHDSSTADEATKETPYMVQHASPPLATPGNQTLNDMRDKKKKKKMKSTDNVLLEGKSLTKSAELKPQENKKKKRNKQSAAPNIISSSPTLSETSLSKSERMSSDSVMKNKHKKVKQRLFNPSDDFLTDY